MSPLPENWSFVPLGKVATLQRGFDLPVQAREPGQIPIFAANGSVGTHTEAKVTGPGVVTGRSGTLGRVHYVDTDFWPLNTALWVNDFHGNDPHWISRLLTWMDLKQFTRGAGVPTLNRNLVHVVEVPLPPLAEQKRIAAILDAADALRAKRRETLAQLDTLLQSTFLDMFGDPVSNPMGWEIEELGKKAKRITKGQSPKWQGFSYQEDGVLFVTSENVREGHLDISKPKFVQREFNDKLKSSELRVGDLLINLVGASIGRSCLFKGYSGPANINQAVGVVTLQDALLANYVVHLLQTKQGQSFLTGRIVEAARANISLKNLRELALPLPPIARQRRFATIVESIERQKTRLHAHLAELDTMFASLQSRAFNGEL